VEPLQVSIVTHNSTATLDDCLDSVFAAGTDLELRVDVVDNASTDGTVERVRERYPAVHLTCSANNLGFGAAHNRILRGCAAPRLLLLNPDARLLPGCLPYLVENLIEEPPLALVGPRIDYPDGSPQLSFGPFPGVLRDLVQGNRTRRIQRRSTRAVRRLERKLAWPVSPDWISGACCLARTSALREVGGFDERYFLFLEDVDLCRRLRARGHSLRVDPRARCVHAEGASQVGQQQTKTHYRRSRLLYEQIHGTRLGTLLRGQVLHYDILLRKRNKMS